MSRDTCKKLVVFCEDKNTITPAGFGNVPMSVKEMLYITIWYLASQIPLSCISLLFDRAISSIWSAIDQITSILEKNKAHFIKWPTAEEAPLVAAKFEDMAGFPGVLGDIDGTHIDFQAPSKNQADYNNRKFHHSLNLLAVCLPNRAFSYTFAGFPGSAHDTRVYRCSDLGQKMYDDPASLFPSSAFCILGDSAFPCTTYLIPAIEAAFANTQEERRFNSKLSKTRIVIEHAFGDLKNTWRRLLFVHANLEKAVKIISACCVLHNFLIENGERFVTYQLIESTDDSTLDEFADDWFSTFSGIEKRNELIDMLGRNE